MPELKDVAHVTRRGGDLPDLKDSGELQTNAWLLYEAARTAAAKASSNAHHYEYNGIPGMRWEVSVNALMMDLWRPKLTNDSDDNRSQTFKRQLNSYLAATENLVCVARSANRSTWWVRDEWNPDAPQPRASVSQRGARVPAAASAAPVPADNAASDVTVSFKCLWGEGCEHTFPTEASRAAHHFVSHRSARSYVAEALAGSDPVPVEILQERLKEMGYPASMDITVRTLTSMRQAGLVRSHGVLGEDGETWSLPGITRAPEAKSAPPSERTAAPVAQGLRCREPGCTEPAFTDQWKRNRHEKQAHPDMSSRKYPCTYPGCKSRFYGPTSVSIHAARDHGVLVDTPAGKTLLSAAIDAAEGKAAPTPADGGAEATLQDVAGEVAASASKATPAKEAAPTPLKEGVDALDAVAALVEEVRQRRAASTEADSLRAENATLRQENASLRDRVKQMRKMVEEW